VAKITLPEGATFGQVALQRNRNVSFKSWKGRPYVAKKQPKRGKPKSKRQEAWVDHFSWMACLSKQPDGWAYNLAKYFADNHNLDSQLPYNIDKWYYRDVIERAFSGHLALEAGEVKVKTPTCNLYRDAYENLTQFVPLMLTPNAIHWDNNVFHSDSVNPSRLTARSPGIYLCGTSVYCQAPVAAENAVSLLVNGLEELAAEFAGDVNPAFLRFNVSGLWYFHEGDYLQVQGYTNNTSVSMQLRHMWMVGITPEAVI